MLVYRVNKKYIEHNEARLKSYKKKSGPYPSFLVQNSFYLRRFIYLFIAVNNKVHQQDITPEADAANEKTTWT